MRTLGSCLRQRIVIPRTGRRVIQIGMRSDLNAKATIYVHLLAPVTTLHMQTVTTCEVHCRLLACLMKAT